MNEPVCQDCTQFLSTNFPHPCFNHAKCVKDSNWLPSACENCLDVFNSADNTDNGDTKDEAIIWLQSYADELRTLCAKTKSKGECIIPMDELHKFGRPWLSKHVFILGSDISNEDSSEKEISQLAEEVLDSLKSVEPEISQAAEQAYTLLGDDLSVSLNVEVSSSDSVLQTLPKSEVSRLNLDTAKASHLGLVVSGADYLFPSGKYTSAGSSSLDKSVMGNTVLSPSRRKPISHVTPEAPKDEALSDLDKISNPAKSSGNLVKPPVQPSSNNSLPTSIDITSLVQRSVNEAMKQFMGNFSARFPAPPSGGAIGSTYGNFQNSSMANFPPVPQNLTSPGLQQSVQPPPQPPVDKNHCSSFWSAPGAQSNMNLPSSSGTSGGGGFTLPNRLPPGGLLPPSGHHYHSQASVSCQNMPFHSSTSVQHGLNPSMDEKESDTQSIDEVLECSETLLDSPHWPGLLALTQVDDDMREFLNQEVAPQVYSFQSSKDVFVSRFGFVLKEREFFCNQVFVGKKDGKLYAIPRLDLEDEDGDMGFLISNLNAVHLFPKDKALDGTKLKNLLTMYCNFADSSLHPMSYNCPEPGKFVLDIKDSLDLGLLAKDPPKTQPLKGLSCSSSVEGDKEILEFLSSTLLNDSHQIKDENGSEIQRGTTSALTKEMLSRDMNLRADASHAIQSLAAISELDKVIGTLPTQFPGKVGLFSGLKGLSQGALFSARSVAHKTLCAAQEQRKFLRGKSLNITEPNLRSSLIESDLWASSLFPSNASQLLSESKKVPALRPLNIKSGANKNSSNLPKNKVNEAMLGKLLKAQKAQLNSNFLRS